MYIYDPGSWQFFSNTTAFSAASLNKKPCIASIRRFGPIFVLPGEAPDDC